MFFLSYFSNSFSECEMWRIFQRWERLAEVFMSKKLNYSGNRFGFMRFFDVKIPGKLERQLDSIRIDALKLYVNLPKYCKGEKRKSKAGTIHTLQGKKKKEDHKKMVKQ